MELISVLFDGLGNEPERRHAMTPTPNPRYYLEKKARRNSAEYPVATIAFYGPDNLFATKVVVGIILTEKDEDVAEFKKWFSTGIDVRKDVRINQEILQFIEDNSIKRVTMVDRIIGCPHEEGIDYPEEETCQQCSYWKNRDRWTGKILS
jgi:hypothetical protein